MKLIRTGLLLFSSLTVLFFAACKKENITNVTNNALNPPIADAGAPQTLTAHSATLSGTGTTENGHITGYLWSLISGPNNPEIMTASASTTIVNNMVEGTYLFQFAVIDSMGLTGIDTTSVTITALPIHTITLQPSGNANELNFAYHDGEASAHQEDLDAGAWTWGGIEVDIRGAFQFDMSAIPSGSTILSAKLSLYSNPTPINGDLVNANSGSDNSMHIRRIIQSWDASTVTWLTQPSTSTTDQILVPHTSSNFLDLIDMDVTAIVQAQMANGNYGFMMGLENEFPYNIRQFASSLHSDASKHPKIVITYQ